jgi:hypothetical protein
MATNPRLLTQASHAQALIDKLQSSAASWPNHDRLELRKLSVALTVNIKRCAAGADSADEATTRARARALMDIVTDIGRLCRRLDGDALAARNNHAILPRSPPTAAASLASICAHGAMLLVATGQREAWSGKDQDTLCKITAAMHASAEDPSGGQLPAIALARCRGLIDLLADVALFGSVAAVAVVEQLQSEIRDFAARATSEATALAITRPVRGAHEEAEPPLALEGHPVVEQPTPENAVATPFAAHRYTGGQAIPVGPVATVYRVRYSGTVYRW